MLSDLLFFVPKEDHSEEALKKLFAEHPEIQFVSLVGVDLSGNSTDEKIPKKLFLGDVKGFLTTGVQTDGSSVVLPGIATINNAKVDMIADTDSVWTVDYNDENIDPETNKPVGTLRIPCFLYHDNVAVDSRSILRNSINHLKETLMELFKKHPEALKSINVEYDDIDEIVDTCATELEFWVKTPNEKTEVEELSTSQVLQESYWTRTKGAVRTSLEQSLTMLDNYGLEPEMGHKEVGGVKAKLDESGNYTHIMEQLEVDWKYSTALQAADNEGFAKALIHETFRNNGLDVTFLAKPIDGVAGSGKHTHFSIALKLKDGRRINLFAPTSKHFLSIFGYASIMGILKNYEVINPFISSTNDAFRRLKPGFEAPVCIVTSIGHSIDIPSRNRTILVGVIRNAGNPLATRFELRSPNAHTNTYLAMATMFMAMLDGMKYALANGKTEDALLAELSKKPENDAMYLEKGRAYRSEEDVFEDYTEAEREAFFGKAPATVYENLCAFDNYPEKLEVLKDGDVLTDKLINSFRMGTMKKWLIEIQNRIINNYATEIRSYKMVHHPDKALDVDVANWLKINDMRMYLMKDSYASKSLFTRIRAAAEAMDYSEVSDLQLELDSKMKALRELYSVYKKNLLDI
ncbi:MAG: glutamine synthetase [Clostridiaceae bacterium]